MAENKRFGRRPCQVVELDQDFCTRTYGEGFCLAGPGENLLKSTDLSDPAFWDSGSAVVSRLPSGGFEGSPAFESSFNQPSVVTLMEVATSELSQAAPLSQGVFAAFDALYVSGDTSGPYASVEVVIRDLGGGLIFQDSIAFNPFDGTSSVVGGSVPLTGGWFRFTFELNPGVVTAIDQPATLNFRFRKLNISTSVYRFSRPQITSGEPKPFRATFGTEKRANDAPPCFNTRSTCQDPANYDKGVQVLKFVEKQSPIPTDDYYRPSVKARGVRVTPAKLNPGGADRNARALGQRASISVSFQDHPDNDRIVDKYRTERDYDPFERGTFWTKWRARNPYYMQRPLRLRSGYLKDGAIVDEITREFVVTGFSGPDSNGNVTLQGKDVLTLAEDEKAQAPIASRGKLAAAITAGAASATLTPAGIGNDEYPADGYIRVGKEVMAFTRSGDSLTLTRGQFGTEAKEHDEDDSVQLCLRYVSQAPQDILYDLLLNYANIPAQYLDKAQWDAEALDFLPRLYTAIITEPNGVSKLISEMCQQMYFTIWWDERLGKVILKSVRLAQEDEVFELDDQKHLIADSVSWKDLADELITQVWVYYGQLDPTEKLDQGSNYATIAITADASAEGADKHNLRRIKTVFSRWIDATNASAAEDLGQRILNRYGNAPRQVTFRVDAKDDYLWLGDYIRLTNRLRVDQFGKAVPVNLQIFEAEEASLGSEYRFTAQEFIPALIGGDQVEDPNERVIPITSDLLNVNLRTLHDSLFGAPSGTEKITFIIREGVTIGGDAAGGGVNVAAGARVSVNDFYDGGNSALTGIDVGVIPILQRAGIGSPRTISKGANYPFIGDADHTIVEYPSALSLDTGEWPGGVELNLIVEAGGRILGQGGNGSAHGTQALVSTSGGSTRWRYKSVPGGDGGDSIAVRHPITITNGGSIYGGGGGGSCVYNANPAGSNYGLARTPGGGGAGFYISGTSTVVIDGSNVYLLLSQQASVSQAAGGSALSSGGGAQWSRDLTSVYDIRKGGAGGGIASAGGDGFQLYRDSSGEFPTNIISGGLPGKAIRQGANLITWVNKGDLRGDEVN